MRHLSAITAILTHVPDKKSGAIRSAVIGKVAEFRDTGDKVFYRDFDWDTSYHQTCDALSCDVRMSDYLLTHPDVGDVYVFDNRGNGRLLTVSTPTFLKHAFVADFGEGEQLYLKMKHWNEVRRDFTVDRTNHVTTI